MLTGSPSQSEGWCEAGAAPQTQGGLIFVEEKGKDVTEIKQEMSAVVKLWQWSP